MTAWAKDTCVRVGVKFGKGQVNLRLWANSHLACRLLTLTLPCLGSPTLGKAA